MAKNQTKPSLKITNFDVVFTKKGTKRVDFTPFIDLMEELEVKRGGILITKANLEAYAGCNAGGLRTTARIIIKEHGKLYKQTKTFNTILRNEDEIYIVRRS
jgi:hypothetical protein